MLVLKLNHVSKRGPWAQYFVILHAACTALTQVDHSLNAQKTSHISPLRVSYEVSIVRILEKMHCCYNNSVVALCFISKQPPETSELVNSVWSSDTKWWQRFGTTLAQVMACCLTALNHYLNKCSLIISGLGGTQVRPISQKVLKILIRITSLKNALVKWLPHLPGANEFHISTCMLQAASKILSIIGSPTAQHVCFCKSWYDILQVTLPGNK